MPHKFQFDRGSHAAGCGNATTYQFYVNMMEAGDRMSAVFGNGAKPLVVKCPRAFSAAENGSWNASATPAHSWHLGYRTTRTLD